jgi:hypothetical protein
MTKTNSINVVKAKEEVAESKIRQGKFFVHSISSLRIFPHAQSRFSVAFHRATKKREEENCRTKRMKMNEALKL